MADIMADIMRIIAWLAVSFAFGYGLGVYLYGRNR